MKALILLALLPGAALAQDVDCSRAMAQVEMTFCAEQDWLAADADLNEAYARARSVMRDIDAELPKSQRGAELALRYAQRAWITFRDQACAAEGYTMHGGSGEPMLIYGCRARLTNERTDGMLILSGDY